MPSSFLENTFKMAKHLPRLVTEVAQQKPKCPADYEEIVRVLFPIFSEDTKAVVLSGRASRDRMNSLISKYHEEDKKALKG